MQLKTLIDLHCDTLTNWEYTSTGNQDTLNDPSRVLSFSSIPSQVNWGQFYAIFIPDEIRGKDAVDYFNSNLSSFNRQMEQFSNMVLPCRNVADMEKAFAQSKVAAFLTVENGSVLAGEISRVEELFNAGVKAVTLVWNGENEIGSGHLTENGLSAFGKSAVKELENHNILVDCSHLNDTGFYDLLKVAKKPFVATHSNARAICCHKRNLTDQMIKEMVRRDCLIGLNYFVDFICDDGVVNSFDDFYRHIEHFFNLGCEDNLALGSDFDGAALPEWLNTPEKSARIYDSLIAKGVSQQFAEKIMYKNAYRFFQKNMA